jgi:transposase
MPRATSGTNVVATIGIDIGKNTFHVIGLDDKGAIILRHKLSRGQVYARLANIPPCLIGMPHLSHSQPYNSNLDPIQ